MTNKDVIIRASGDLDTVQLLLEEAALEVKKLGLDCAEISIRQVPTNISKSSIQNKKARDLKISVLGNEKVVEDFIEAVADFIKEDLALLPPSINISLPKD